MSAGGGQLGHGMAGKGEHLMPLFRRKTCAVALAAGRRVTQPAARGEIDDPLTHPLSIPPDEARDAGHGLTCRPDSLIESSSFLPPLRAGLLGWPLASLCLSNSCATAEGLRNKPFAQRGPAQSQRRWRNEWRKSAA